MFSYYLHFANVIIKFLKILNFSLYEYMINNPTSSIIKVTIVFNSYLNFDNDYFKPTSCATNFYLYQKYCTTFITIYNIQIYYCLESYYFINV